MSCIPRKCKLNIALPMNGLIKVKCFKTYSTSHGFSFLVVERRRRFNINDRIKELGMLIPKAGDL